MERNTFCIYIFFFFWNIFPPNIIYFIHYLRNKVHGQANVPTSLKFRNINLSREHKPTKNEMLYSAITSLYSI